MDAASALDQYIGEVDEQGQSLKDRSKARFEDRSILDKLATEENGGTPVYVERTYVVIKCPKQDPQSFVAEESHIKRFPRAYQEFRNRRTAMDGAPGTPILEWNGIPATKARGLYAVGILTVEQLAESDLSKLGVSKETEFFQRSAQKYLAKESEKDERIAELEEQLGKVKPNDSTNDSTKRSGSNRPQKTG